MWITPSDSIITNSESNIRTNVFCAEEQKSPKECGNIFFLKYIAFHKIQFRSGIQLLLHFSLALLPFRNTFDEDCYLSHLSSGRVTMIFYQMKHIQRQCVFYHYHCQYFGEVVTAEVSIRISSPILERKNMMTRTWLINNVHVHWTWLMV